MTKTVVMVVLLLGACNEERESGGTSAIPSERRRLASMMSENLRKQGIGEVVVATRGPDDSEITISGDLCNQKLLEILANDKSYSMAFRNTGVRKISCSSGSAEKSAPF